MVKYEKLKIPKIFVRRTILFKISSGVIAIIVLSLSIVASLSYYNGKKQLEKEIMDKLIMAANNKASAIESYLYNKIRDVKLLSHRTVLIEAIQNLNKAFKENGLSSAEYMRFYRQINPVALYYKNIGGFQDFLLISKDGDVIFSLDKDGEYIGNNLNADILRDNPLTKIVNLTNSLFETEISEFTYSDKTELPVIFIGTPIIEPNKILGTVVLELNTIEINDILRNYSESGDTGEIVIGQRIRDEAVFVMPTRHDPDAAFKIKVNMKTQNDSDIPLVQALRGNEGHGIYYDYRNKKVLAAWQYLPLCELGLVIKIDEKEALDPVIKLRNNIFIVAIIFMVLGVAASILIARSISGPVQLLHKGTEIIGEGNLDYKVGINSADEIGQLSRSFDEMTDKLKHSMTSVENLNKEIAERKKAESTMEKKVKELELFNKVAVDRELKMIELKNKIRELEKK